jgi:hypothetical protein
MHIKILYTIIYSSDSCLIFNLVRIMPFACSYSKLILKQWIFDILSMNPHGTSTFHEVPTSAYTEQTFWTYILALSGFQNRNSSARSVKTVRVYSEAASVIGHHLMELP